MAAINRIVIFYIFSKTEINLKNNAKQTAPSNNIVIVIIQKRVLRLEKQRAKKCLAGESSWTLI